MSTIRYQCRKMPVSVKAKHKSIHASIHRRFTGGFFFRHHKNQAPCTQPVTRGRLGEGLSPFISHP
ncbi:hypothetical protein GDQ75_22030, partial [Shigella boydii]|nr:hypothetical protein [Shigella boydii]